ncbi:MAG: hypothetical protein ACPKQO_01540 [Nitrososphaeraceae archaeon]
MKISDKEIKAKKEVNKSETSKIISELREESKNLKEELDSENLKEKLVDNLNNKYNYMLEQLDEELKILKANFIMSELDLSNEKYSVYNCLELVKSANGIFDVELYIGNVLEKTEGFNN